VFTDLLHRLRETLQACRDTSGRKDGSRDTGYFKNPLLLGGQTVELGENQVLERIGYDLSRQVTAQAPVPLLEREPPLLQ